MPAPAPLRVLHIAATDGASLRLELERDGWELDYQRVESESGLRAALDAPPEPVLCEEPLPRWNLSAALRLVKQHRPQ